MRLYVYDLISKYTALSAKVYIIGDSQYSAGRKMKIYYVHDRPYGRDTIKFSHIMVHNSENN